MPTTAEITTQLRSPFPPDVLGSITKGGRKLTYVPVAEVVLRLNEVVGVDNWSAEATKVWRDEIEPDWIICQVRLTARIDGVTVVKDQFGGQKIKKLQNKDEAVDIGDEYKGAFSDGLKKCAQMLGIGIDLSRKEEAIRYDNAKAHQAETQAAQATLPEDIAAIKADIAKLIPRGVDQFRKWWKLNQLPPVDQLTIEAVGDVRDALNKFLAGQEDYLLRHPEEAPGYQPPVPLEEEAPPTPEEEAAVASVTAMFPGSQESYGLDEEPF